MENAIFEFVTGKEDIRFLKMKSKDGSLDGTQLNVAIQDLSGRRKIYPVFQQKARSYGDYSAYINSHGCACCSLTTILAAYVPKLSKNRPEDTICTVEREVFGTEIWEANYTKSLKRQMPVSLYGISKILDWYDVPNRYVASFEDKSAHAQITDHLRKGHPVIIETSRMRRKNGRVIRWFDKKYAGSYHTMILLGFDKKGEVIFTDSATRAWSGSLQRIKKANLKELINYMFSRKNEKNESCYFTRRKNTGGYILVE